VTHSALFCLFIPGQDCPFGQPIADGQSVWDHYFCNTIRCSECQTNEPFL